MSSLPNVPTPLGLAVAAASNRLEIHPGAGKSMKAELEQYRMTKPVELPFTGDRAMADYSKLTRTIMPPEEIYMTGPSDEQMFDNMIKTMDAMKDLIDWVRVHTKTIEMTYNNDHYRREIHLKLLRAGFRALTEGNPNRDT